MFVYYWGWLLLDDGWVVSRVGKRRLKLGRPYQLRLGRSYQLRLNVYKRTLLRRNSMAHSENYLGRCSNFDITHKTRIGNTLSDRLTELHKLHFPLFALLELIFGPRPHLDCRYTNFARRVAFLLVPKRFPKYSKNTDRIFLIKLNHPITRRRMGRLLYFFWGVRISPFSKWRAYSSLSPSSSAIWVTRELAESALPPCEFCSYYRGDYTYNFHFYNVPRAFSNLMKNVFRDISLGDF